MESKKIDTILEALADVLAQKNSDIYFLQYDIGELKKKLEAAEAELAELKKAKEENDVIKVWEAKHGDAL